MLDSRDSKHQIHLQRIGDDVFPLLVYCTIIYDGAPGEDNVFQSARVDMRINSPNHV